MAIAKTWAAAAAAAHEAPKLHTKQKGGGAKIRAHITLRWNDHQKSHNKEKSVREEMTR